MAKIITFIKLLRKPISLISPLASNGFIKWMSDEMYAKLVYKSNFGKNLNLDNPRTFNEKLQWLKLYYRRPEFTSMVDKYRVRELIQSTIGEQYLIPLLGVWESANEIDFDKLPNQFVLKCNHDQGSVVICRDKSKLDYDKVIKTLNKKLKRNHYWATREWPYKNVKPCIICEQYMANSDTDDELSDYKVLCFSGRAKIIEVHKSRFSNRTQDFYDTNWNKLDIRQIGINASEEVMDCPVFLDKMLELSELLAKQYPHLRVDWYFSNNMLLFSELTFYDGGGFDPFYDDFDEKICEFLILPQKYNKGECN